MWCVVLGFPLVSIVPVVIAAVVVIWSHRENVRRLVHGEERRFSFHSSGDKEKGGPRMSRPILVAPSILAADHLHMADELASIATADLVHFDVMDGHFVPNLSFGPDFLRAVKSATELPVDAHLMISNPDDMAERYLDAGADVLTFHYESALHAHRLVSLIHERGARASIALNPATPVCLLEPIIDDLDMVLVMTVDPGFGGQRLIDSLAQEAAAAAAALRRARRRPAHRG